jgi:hypothetical protein
MALGVVMVGSLFGAVPALAAAPEAPVTEAPSPLAGTTATLKGGLVPGASTEKVAYHFAYSAGAECTESGLTAPGEPFPEAEDNKKVSEPVTGLEGSTQYTVCLIAANPAEPAESTQGNTVKFETAPEKPLIESQSSSGITPTTATLEAQVNPENQPTERCEFEYGATASYGHITPCVEPGVLEGSSVQTATGRLKGLKPGHTYHWRVVVRNETGETKGSPDQTLTTVTLEKPSISGETFSGITPFAATLEAVVNPNYQATTYKFEYSTEKTKVEKGEATVVGEGSFGEEFAENGVSTGTETLEPSTVYFYRVVAENATGKTEGPVEEFTSATLEKPIVSTGGPSSVGAQGATLNGTVNPNYQETSYAAEYATSEAKLGTAEATKLAGESPLGAEFAEDSVTVFTGVLAPDTTYYYRIVATNGSGTTEATGIESFTTLAAPLVSTGEATEVTETTAMLSGTVEPAGSATSYHFVYLSQSAYEADLALGIANPISLGAPTQQSENIGEDSTVHPAGPVQIGELQPGTIYRYALLATNSVATTTGPERTFTTLGTPSPPPPGEGEALNPGPGPSPFPAATLPAFVPFQTIAQLQAKEPKTTVTPTTPLTNAEKLAKALKACHKKKGAKRTKCEKQARAKYGKKPKKK